MRDDLTGGEPLSAATKSRKLVQVRAGTSIVGRLVGTTVCASPRTWQGRGGSGRARALAFSRCARLPFVTTASGTCGVPKNTVEGAEIPEQDRSPFIVQMTAGSHNFGQLEAIADFAHDCLAAKVWVPCRRDAGSSSSRTLRMPAARCRLALPKIRSNHTAGRGEREVRSALHQDRSGACRLERAADEPAKAPPSSGQTVVARLISDQGPTPGAADARREPITRHAERRRSTPRPYLPVFAGGFRSFPRRPGGTGME